MSDPTEPKFFKIADLQDRWGVCRMTIHREVKRGRLKRKLIGNSVRFEREEVFRYERKAG